MTTVGAWTTPDAVTWPTSLPDSFDDAAKVLVIQAASDILYDLSGGLFPGVLTGIDRPCAQLVDVDESPRRVFAQPARYDGAGFGWWPGPGRGELGWCSCNRSARTGHFGLPEIRLWGAPLVSVTTVKIDGQVVPSGQYRIDDRRYLVGLNQPDGTRRTWPCCQRMDLADSAPGTFSVAYRYGEEPPAGGVMAANVLAPQLALSVAGDSACKLPARTQSVVRQGVTQRLSGAELFPQGITDLPMVDLWLASINLAPKRRGASFVTPRRRRRVRRPQ